MMTVKRIKSHEEYYFDCDLTEDYKNENDIDEWGCASIWVGNIGVEYNFCIDSGNNCSAIYLMSINDGGFAETDYNKFIHYEINFNKEGWKDELENAMCKALIKFYSL